MGRLTDQRKLWAAHYIQHWNATRAAREAGYSEGAVSGCGQENAHDASVGQYIAHLLEERNKRVKIDADYVLRRIVEIDQLDVSDILDNDGCVRPVREWPKPWRTSISALDFGKLMRVGNDTERLIQLIDKIKWPDKVRNLELLGKHVAVRAWDREPTYSAENALPLQITFEVAPARSEVRVTNAKT